MTAMLIMIRLIMMMKVLCGSFFLCAIYKFSFIHSFMMIRLTMTTMCMAPLLLLLKWSPLKHGYVGYMLCGDTCSKYTVRAQEKTRAKFLFNCYDCNGQ